MHMSFYFAFIGPRESDHGRDPLAGRGQGPRAGGDREPDALHRGVCWQER